MSLSICPTRHRHLHHVHPIMMSFMYDGLLYQQGLLYIHKGLLRLEILQVCHDSNMFGHFGIAQEIIQVCMVLYGWPFPNH